MNESIKRRPEVEAQKTIKVETLYMIEESGRRRGVRVESRDFTTLKGAFEWAAKDPNYSHRIVMPYERAKKIKAQVKRAKNGKEILEIETDGKKGISSPLVKNHHDISTDSRSFFHILVEGVNERMFEKKYARIRFEDQKEPILDFTLKPGNHTAEKLREAFEGLDRRVTQVINDLCLGASKQFLPPLTKPSQN